MKYLWSHRYFEVGYGWQSWYIREVTIIAETEKHYKIKYKLGIITVSKWISKDGEENRMEKITNYKNCYM